MTIEMNLINVHWWGSSNRYGIILDNRLYVRMWILYIEKDICGRALIDPHVCANGRERLGGEREIVFISICIICNLHITKTIFKSLNTSPQKYTIIVCSQKSEAISIKKEEKYER